ncbi:hypothetical protein FFF34_006650 [Inquilinus sp. KBS0705]|nr:hypothetical protein FFF34_006650 [Inquilinus sp. KBS0705]
MLNELQRILNIRLEFDNALKLNTSLAAAYKHIVVEAINRSSFFEKELLIAQEAALITGKI